jgi:hypothetical protein
MKDFLSFVLRGGWTGVGLSVGLMVLFYGSLGAFMFLSLDFLIYALPPGAIVGFVLWLIAGKAVKPLTPGFRFGIGTIVVAVILVLMWGYQATKLDANQLEYLDIPSTLMRLGVLSAGWGGLAGLACPASREYRPEPELTYRERTQLYEAAEQEAKAARESSRSKRVIALPPGLRA